MSEQRGKSVLEKHIQTILLTIVTAGIVWVGATLLALSKDFASLSVTVGGLKDQVQKYDSADYMKKSDLPLFLRAYDNEIIYMKERMARLEGSKK